MIKEELNMQMNPIDLINASFYHYSDATPEGRAAVPGNWNVLVNNYNNYNNYNNGNVI